VSRFDHGASCSCCHDDKQPSPLDKFAALFATKDEKAAVKNDRLMAEFEKTMQKAGQDEIDALGTVDSYEAASKALMERYNKQPLDQIAHLIDEVRYAAQGIGVGKMANDSKNRFPEPTEANVLDDIHGFINKAVANGEAFGTFRAGMLDIMAKTDWYGKAGKTAEDTAYINWRIKIIYNTNMRTAYAAARYREQLENAEDRPIWVYISKLHGKNRRQEHILLNNKAFRYDDPFWNTYYPLNGWGCQCRVTTKSEHGAERDGVKVLQSGADGNPPAISGEDWSKFDPTWKYNPGRESLAPNFDKYDNLKKYPTSKDEKPVLTQVMARYQTDMNKTRMTQG